MGKCLDMYVSRSRCEANEAMLNDHASIGPSGLKGKHGPRQGGPRSKPDMSTSEPYLIQHGLVAR